MTTILSTNVLIRAPREDELTTIVEMLNVCDVADCGQPDSPLEQVQSEWRDEKFQLATDAWVAVAPDERIVGYMAVEQHRYTRIRFYGRVHPDYRNRGIGTHLLALAEQRAREFVSLAEPDARVFMQTWCHGNNQSAKRLLEAADMTCNRHTWAMAIELPEAPARPVWPANVVLRPFVPERDARAVFETKEESFRDHWGSLPGDFERWYRQNITNRDGFDPSLWFIAMAGEQIAGIALCGYYLEDGSVDILGVRRPWRRLGLGLALLHHAFGEFYRRGTSKVALGVDSQNLTGATRLYERAGMYIELTYDSYEKELRAGVDLRTQTLEE